MKIKDLETGKCYTVWDDAEYLVCYKTDEWAIILSYSCNHHVAVPRIINQEWLDQEWAQNLKMNTEWPFTDFIENFKYVDDSMIKEEEE